MKTTSSPSRPTAFVASRCCVRQLPHQMAMFSRKTVFPTKSATRKVEPSRTFTSGTWAQACSSVGPVSAEGSGAPLVEGAGALVVAGAPLGAAVGAAVGVSVGSWGGGGPGAPAPAGARGGGGPRRGGGGGG